MRSGDSIVSAMKNAGSPVLKRKKSFKFCDYTSQQVYEYFSARMPLQKQDLEDCVELMREALDLNKPLDPSNKLPDFDEMLEDMKFLDIGRGFMPTVDEALFYDKMTAFIQQSDRSVLSAKDQSDINIMISSTIPAHSKRLIGDLLRLRNLDPRDSYDYMANTHSPEHRMKAMTLYVKGWKHHCKSLATRFTTMLNLIWNTKNMPGTLNFDADMFQKQYVDPLLSAVLEFKNAAAEDEKISAYIKSYERSQQLEDGMYAMAACVYPKKYHEYIKDRKECDARLATWKQEWQQKPSFKM